MLGGERPPHCRPSRDTVDGLPGPAPAQLLVHVSVLVGLHLRQAQHSVLTFPAVVMGLLPGVTAAVDGAVLGRGELLEASSQDAVQLLMLPAVSHNFVGVSAVIVALQTVEMTGTFLIGTCNGIVNVMSSDVGSFILCANDHSFNDIIFCLNVFVQL